MSQTLLIPNIGAEESLGGADDSDFVPADLYSRAAEFADAADPVLQTAALWRLLFGSKAGFALPRKTDVAPFWPAGFGQRPGGPVFDWLETSAAAWLNTTGAEKMARDRDQVLLGASSEIVKIVHDKCFSHRVALEERLVPTSIDSLIEVLEPAALRDAAAARSWIVDSVNRWPDWTARRFTLKPRFGTSGRGRVAGTGDRIAAGDGGFRRLADCGGAILEPWLHRTVDLSAQMWIEPDGQIVLLGTTELVVEPSGLYRGHRGTVDSRGRVHCASPFDEPLREAAVDLARAAFAAGYWGPCGLDAFAFNAGDREVFRPVVEFNARFTLGTVVIGLLRRLLPWIREALSLEPGGLRAFYFGLSESWPASERGLFVPLSVPHEMVSPEGDSSASPGPGLLLGMDRDALDEELAGGEGHE